MGSIHNRAPNYPSRVSRSEDPKAVSANPFIGAEDELRHDPVTARLIPDEQPRLFVFLFGLPTEMPVGDGSTWDFEMPGDLGTEWDFLVERRPTEAFTSGPVVPARIPHASVKVWQVRREEMTRLRDLGPVRTVAAAVFPNVDPARFTPVEIGGSYDTVVEVVTQAARADVEDQRWPLVSVCFERSLTAVNELLFALGGATDDPELRPVSVDELGPAALVASRPLDGGVDVEPQLYGLNLRLRVPREAIDQEGVERLGATLSARRQEHPFLVYGRLSRDARRAKATGDYPGAAVLAATSGEVLLNTVLRAILVEEGRADTIESMFGDPRGGFISRLRREYAPRLGGRWEPNSIDTEVGHWFDDTHSLRNSVLHVGHRPTPSEAASALHGAGVLEAFVFERLASKRYQYPKTVLSTLGEPGLRRRGLINAKMGRIVAASVPELRAFWATLRSPVAGPKESGGGR